MDAWNKASNYICDSNNYAAQSLWHDWYHHSYPFYMDQQNPGSVALMQQQQSGYGSGGGSSGMGCVPTGYSSTPTLEDTAAYHHQQHDQYQHIYSEASEQMTTTASQVCQ